MVIIENIESLANDDRMEVRANIFANNKTYPIWFRWQGKMCPMPADAFLAIAIIPAMRLGEKLVVKGQVSEKLLHNSYKIQEIYHSFDRRLSIIDIEVDKILPWDPIAYFREKETDQRTVGSFFSGGVDSFYTLGQHIHEIETLIFVQGFDIPLNNLSLRHQVSQSLQQAATQLDKNLVEVETNLRYLSNAFGDWGEIYHGAALAAVGTILSSLCSEIYIPSSYPYYSLFPWGSHPLLDPLFSSNLVELIHDGCEAYRIEKIKAISNDEIAMNTLRVCYKNPNNHYNCGQCVKCLWTMAYLQQIDSLAKCKTFNCAIDTKKLANSLKNSTFVLKQVIRSNLEIAEELGVADRELLNIMYQAVSDDNGENFPQQSISPSQPYQRIDIDDYLKPFSNTKIQYILFPGNAGDAVIAIATYSLLEKHNIQSITWYSDDDDLNNINGGVVFLGGGGNLVHYYYDADKIISQVLKRCDKLVILPHTIQGHYRLLHHLPDKVEILCRDIPSYELMISLYSNKEKVFLCEDLAFSYSPPDRGKIHQKVGNLFRIDIEMVGHNIPTDNVDISQTIPQKFPKKTG